MSSRKPAVGKEYHVASQSGTLGVFIVMPLMAVITSVAALSLLNEGAAVGNFDWDLTRDHLNTALGIDRESIWAITGVFATITVAAVIVLGAAGRELTAAHARWENGGRQGAAPTAESGRATGHLFVQMVLFFLLAVTATFAAALQSWGASVILALLAAFFLVELTSFLNDLWKYPGVYEERDRSELQQRLVRLKSLPAESAIAATVWLFAWVAPVALIGDLIPHDSKTGVSSTYGLAVLAAFTATSYMIRVEAHSQTRSTRTFFQILAWVFFVIGELGTVSVGGVLWVASESWTVRIAATVCFLVIVCLLALGFFGFNGKGYFRSFARWAIRGVTRERDKLQTSEQHVEPLSDLAYEIAQNIAPPPVTAPSNSQSARST